MIYKAMTLVVLIVCCYFDSCKKRYSIYLIAWLLLTVTFTFIGRSVMEESKSILIPLEAYYKMCKYTWHYSSKYIAEGLLGNVLLFVPLGELIRNVSNIRLRKVIVVAMIFSISIEITQYFTKLGVFEADDIIHNTLGAVIGYQIVHFKYEKNFKVLIPLVVFLGALSILSLYSYIVKLDW